MRDSASPEGCTRSVHGRSVKHQQKLATDLNKPTRCTGPQPGFLGAGAPGRSEAASLNRDPKTGGFNETPFRFARRRGGRAGRALPLADPPRGPGGAAPMSRVVVLAEHRLLAELVADALSREGGLEVTVMGHAPGAGEGPQAAAAGP